MKFVGRLSRALSRSFAKSSKIEKRTIVDIKHMRFLKFDEQGYALVFQDNANKKKLRLWTRICFLIGIMDVYVIMAEIGGRFRSNKISYT